MLPSDDSRSAVCLKIEIHEINKIYEIQLSKYRNPPWISIFRQTPRWVLYAAGTVRRRTDGRTPCRYITLSALDAASVKMSNRYYSGQTRGAAVGCTEDNEYSRLYLKSSSALRHSVPVAHARRHVLQRISPRRVTNKRVLRLRDLWPRTFTTTRPSSSTHPVMEAPKFRRTVPLPCNLQPSRFLL